MLSAWLQTTINVQRRTGSPSRNALNEPNYGVEGSYPTIYSGIWCRIEFWSETTQFVEAGERMIPVRLEIYVESNYIIQPEDRIVIASNDDPSLVGQLYIVDGVFPEYDAMGHVHHYMIECIVH